MTQVRTPEQRQHMLDVADAFEAHANQFDMNNYANKGECGTVMCIAGWSTHLQGYEWSWYVFGGGSLARVTEDGFHASDLAANAMGLSELEAVDLFVNGIDAAESMPVHLRAKGMSDAVRQIADGVPVRLSLIHI